ncbi:dipeptidase [Alienimonas californiensis]|uniref:N-formyl-4-amino-5-aminomethyl-2-methylpyrimidine deformylase n=1 Tax=Alienimonas californiensis TaxID=2527989 RepID=A0A517PA28_9PLAN|nr:dipeptidase [Alienimonas californiensis]QDT16236.1 N-formyl-4-amino-5-aminomethyl-2-methylpyrimidine deformylase [Alienimonas californiensis]
MTDFAPVADRLAASAEANRERLFELLRIPSVSADPAHRGDCRAAAEWVRDFLTQAGCSAELVDTGTAERPGHPIVFAKTPRVDGAPTLLVYGHYDVQPPDPLDLWTTPPFEPTVRPGPGGAEHVYARGATDDKGQMLTHPLAVAAWHAAAGGPPVNVTFVIEGEEEVGSDHLDAFLESHKAELACDAAVISDTSQFAPGVPAICYGLRGITACEVTVRGPKADLHSGLFGGAVANPANALAKIIASLHDADGRVAVPGFYDAVVPPTEEERAAWAALPFDEAAFLETTGAPEPVTLPDATVLEGRWGWPTCDVNGLTSGYQGPGPKTIIPAKASAKLSFRLVPDQDPHAILAAVREHVTAHCPRGVTVEVTPFHGTPGVRFDTDSAPFEAAKQAVEHAFGTPPVMIREGGTIPVVRALGATLGCPVLLLGWGQNSDGLHSPNERFSLDAFRRGALASARLMWELAR